MKTGDRIKYSEHRLRPARDYWLNCGRHEQKSAAHTELQRLQAWRGTVVKVERNRFGVVGVEYAGDDGTTGNAMEYQFEKV